MSPARSADDNGPRAEEAGLEGDDTIVGGFTQALAALAREVLAAEAPRRARLERALAMIAGPVALLAAACVSAPLPLSEKSEPPPLPEKSELSPPSEEVRAAHPSKTALAPGFRGGNSCRCGGRASGDAPPGTHTNFYDQNGFYNEAADPVAIHFAAAAEE